MYEVAYEQNSVVVTLACIKVQPASEGNHLLGCDAM